jgi:hypothetical protein
MGFPKGTFLSEITLSAPSTIKIASAVWAVTPSKKQEKKTNFPITSGLYGSAP